MTATDVTSASRSTSAHGQAGAGTGADAVVSWITTTDHTKVGRLYTGFSLAQVLGGLGIAVVLGVERVDPAGAALIKLQSVTQLFAAYRWTLVLGGVLPLLVGLGIALVPHLVGADTVAFPRAAAASLWGWLLGSGTMIAASIADGGPGGRHPDAVQLWNVALILAAASIAVGAACVATTVVALRRPGLRLDQVNPFAWAMFVVSSILVLALPVLIAITILVFADVRFANQTFGGGSAELDRYVGWLTGQPQVLLLGLPALAVLAEIMGSGSSKGRGVRLGAMGAIGLLSFGPWVQDAFTPKVLNQGWFGVVAILAPIAVLAVLGSTAAKPASAASAPLAIGGALLVTLGALLGVLRPFTTFELKGTVFGDGYTALVVIGGLLGLLAALVHWGPMLWGSGPVAAPKAMGLGLLGTVGGFLAGAPLIISGLQKQPTNVVNFATKSGTQALNVVSLVGFALVLLTVLGAVGLFATSFRPRHAQD